MILTEKQTVALNIIEQHFRKNIFNITDIKEYDEKVSVATLANLASKGVLQKVAEKPAQYKYVEAEYRIAPEQKETTAEKIVELETATIYDSAQKATLEKGKGFSRIKDAANGSRRIAGGLHWCKLKDLPINFTNEDCQQKIESIDAAFGFFDGVKVNRGKRVLNIDLNQEFYSAAEAARFYNLSSDAIASCCRGERATAAGYHWKYVEE